MLQGKAYCGNNSLHALWLPAVKSAQVLISPLPVLGSFGISFLLITMSKAPLKRVLPAAAVDNPAKRQLQQQQQSGMCKCSSCGQWSKDCLGANQTVKFTLWTSPSLPCEDTPWALRKSTKSGEVAVEDKCEACFALWRRAFGHLTWEAFCDTSDTSISKGKLEAKQLLNDPDGKRPYTHAVKSSIKYSFNIAKDFLVMNEAEIRKWTKLARVPKKLLAGIPTVQVGNEEVYVFTDPDAKFRRGTLTVSSDTCMEDQSLSPQDILWHEQ
eukprot:5040070-Amphidinium_carterae.1